MTRHGCRRNWATLVATIGAAGLAATSQAQVGPTALKLDQIDCNEGDFVSLPYVAPPASRQGPGGPIGAMTITAWVKPSDFVIPNDGGCTGGGPADGTIMGWGGGGNPFLNFVMDNGTMTLIERTFSGANAPADPVAGVVPPCVWTHVAVTHSGGQLKFYINGLLDTTTTIALTNEGIWTNTWTIGGMNRFGIAAGGFDGLIQEVSCWNVALSEPEILQVALLGIDNSHPQYGNVVGYYKMNDGSGQTVTDFTGNQDGTLGLDAADVPEDDPEWAGEGDSVCTLPGLSLELADCPDDADPVEPGYQIAVELWMRDLPSAATGFQAFLNYDDTALNYRGDLSTYSASPFELHIQNTAGAEVAAGELRLDGSDNFGEPGETADSLLATLIFDVDVDCSSTVPVTFDIGQPFISELSFDGDPLETALADADSVSLDDTAPVLDPCPADITQPADANDGDGCQGAFVTFTDPMATDNCDPAPVVVCTPASGSFFPVGTTTVTCVATDSCGNESSCTFDVTVTPTNAIDLEVELAGVNIAVVRCIYVATDDCSFNDVTLDFIDHDGDDANENGIVDATEGGLDTPSTSVRAIATIEVPCGNWTMLCAKDEQHTLWDTTTLSVAAAYSGDTLLSLGAGDTDNDGDVDINDVTLLIAQFGDPALPGGCPWDGTRDSDFSNNGVVGSEDYSLLSANWLVQSNCSCAMAFNGKGDEARPTAIWADQLPRDVVRRVDLDRNGVINYMDVAIFEQMNGLSNDLSTRILLSEQRRP